jgi:putative transposase
LKESSKSRYIQINLPIKHYKYSLKYKNDDSFKLKNTINIRKKKGVYYIDYICEKPDKPKKKEINKRVGIDIGYNKLIVSSNNNFYGFELKKVYEKISRKKQGSKAFKKALTERDNLINRVVKEFVYNEKPDIVYIEKLKKVKHKSKQNKKIHTKFMNKLQRWSYSKVISKLYLLSQQESFLIEEVNPAYTSVTCSKCGFVHKNNRNKELFKCVKCGILMDADYNASLNILHRGVYSPSAMENSS